MAEASNRIQVGRLSGKIAVITGTGGSIGRASAQLFAKEGAKVVGCDLNAESAEETLRMVTDAGGDMISVQPCDLTKQSEVTSLIQKAIDDYGQINILFNNAGMAWFAWIHDMTYEEWRKTMDIELDALFLLCKEAWPHLIKHEGASIINMGSVSGKQSYEVLPGLAHMAAKGGVIAMTKQLAMEGGAHNLRANSISPGTVYTNQTKQLAENKDWLDRMLSKLMIKRLGQPEDIAQAAVFLASNESSWVTGADFAIDGGSMAW